MRISARNPPVLRARKNTVVSLILDEHRHYLADQVRTAAFRQAIEEIVKPGDVVIDMGAGTGILGLLACQAGANKVYSIDSGGVIELARKLCQANGLEDRMTFVKGLSTRVDLPEKADVVLADQIGFGSEFGLFEYFDDARERFLKPDSIMIPSRVDMYIAPVECPQIYEEIELWNSAPAGFDFRPARSLAVNTCYRPKLAPEQILSEPAMGASVSLGAPTPTTLNLTASFVAARAGTLHGIGGWFAAQLSQNVCITNSPLSQHAIDRNQVFFPSDQPIDVVEGQLIEIAMHILTADHVVTWNVEVRGAAGEHDGQLQLASRAKFSHSTWKGMLVAQEDLRKTRPDFVPILKPRAEAWQTVLQLCDGQRSVAEIERELYRRHADLFRSPAEAATLVAEVISDQTV
jgi:Arginine methyltransferase oligomerization subdomain/Ribosomal protein L11 methyltransferase (PrmA)